MVTDDYIEVAVKEIPSEYMNILYTGFYDAENETWKFNIKKQFKE